MKKENQENTFEKATEIVGWIQIFLSPMIMGVIISAIIYLSNPNNLTFIIGIIVLALAFVIGVKLASKIKEKTGTINFLSNTSSTSGLDENLNNKNDTR